MDSLLLPPVSHVQGAITPPGSKSISNRVLPLAALAQGTTRLFNLPDGEDVELMREALKQLIISMHEVNGVLIVHGLGGPFKTENPKNIFLGNSGTSMRTLSALLCGGHGRFTLDGIARMRERPICDLIDAMQKIMGNTEVTYLGEKGYPPLEIFAQGLKGGRSNINGSVSSQFLTGLLLAMPLCKENVEVEVEGPLVSKPYVELTLRIMETFGVKIANQNFKQFSYVAPQKYHSPGDYHIEPDASSASYFLAAGAIAGGDVTVNGIGKNSLQGEAQFATVLEKMGAKVVYTTDAITVSKGTLKGIDVDMDLMSDTGMTLAVTALFADGPTTIRGIGNWRVKETDRIHAMATELRKVGAHAEEGEDWIKITPPQKMVSAEIATYNDHRMAMCFSLVSLAQIPITILNPNCTRKTYPKYFEAFKSICKNSAQMLFVFALMIMAINLVTFKNSFAADGLKIVKVADSVPFKLHPMPVIAGPKVDSLAQPAPLVQPSVQPLIATPAQSLLISKPTSYVTYPTPFLKKDLEDFYKRGRMRGRLAFSVYSTKYGRLEASLNDTDWFTPASCLKLIVTAAAIDTFPINFFPATVMDLFGKVENHSLKGHVLISGQGDPNVSDRFFPDALSPLEPFIDSLKALGIDTIEGNVEVTDTFFTGSHKPEAWKQHHFNTWYGAEVSALSYNDNTFTLTVGPGAKPGAPAFVKVIPDVGYVRIVNRVQTRAGRKRRIVPAQNKDSTVITLTGYVGTGAASFQMILPVRNPTQYFRASFLKVLANQGITYKPTPAVLTPTATAPATPALTPVATAPATPQTTLPHLASYRFTTAPQTDIVEEINQRSQNLHAEMTLRQLGKFVKGDGSSNGGIKAEKQFLHRIGLDTNDFKLYDACGLSSSNKIKPRAMAQLLAKMARHKYVKDYIGSLAAPGLDGATGRRLRPYMQSNLLRFKTGTVSQVQGLSGYAFGIDGDTLAVALFLNEYRGSSEGAIRLMDSLLVHVALWYNKERPALIESHRLLTRADAPKNYFDRLKYFSKALEEKPYFLGPTGEGRFGRIDPLPMMDMSRFDCVTYIESVMALALSKQTKEVLPNLISLRYHSDTIDYTTRNHFFVEDWLKQNSSRVKIVRFPGDTLIHKPIDKIKFFGSKQLPAPKINPISDIAFTPYAKALEMMSHWTFGEKFLGVAFTTDIAGLDVTHTGFLIADGKNPPLFRNASLLKGKVATIPFKEYLELRKGKCSGVVFFEFIPPGT